MNAEKIKRLIELLVEREVKRQIPTIRKQILSELKINSNVSNNISTSKPARPYLPPKKRVHKNPILNELLLSTQQVEDDDDDNFDWKAELGTITEGNVLKQEPGGLSPSDFAGEVKTEASKDILNIMNRDYSTLVKKMDSLPKSGKSLSMDEDLGFLDNVK
jgi:hypothetical protein